MTEIATEAPNGIADPRLKSLYGYWSDKKGARPLPGRADIDPLEMKDWLGNLMLIEFPGDITTYRIRLDGTNLEHYYGSRRTGRGIETLTSEEERDLILEQYRPVIERKSPAYIESEFINSDGVFSRQAKLILPLSSDGERVDMVLVGIYFRSESGTSLR
ncbi:MAG: PAS domain-containing protein [Rhodospirillaceae bacterium]|nr:PAS domain-containing protein [Rhodospirillaceae bacterium]